MLKRISLLLIIVVAIGSLSLSAKAPKEYVLKTPLLDEASGLASSHANAGILYSQNDSGGKAAIYGINSEGKLLHTLELKGIKNRDWEDIATATDPATGISYVYVGEIGDNGARYPSVYVYRFAEPKLSPADSMVVIDKIETYEIAYEDSARDAEALFVHPKTMDIYIISKREEQVGLYLLKQPLSTTKLNVASRIASLPIGWVTAADIHPSGKKLLVKTYPTVWQFKCKLNKQGELVLSGKPKVKPYIPEPQGEAITYDSRGKGYFTLSEAAEDTEQVLYYYK